MPNQLHPLLYRILHLFLRVAGYDLGLALSNRMMTYIREEYVQLSMWCEAIDCAITATDLIFLGKNGALSYMLFKMLNMTTCLETR